MGIGAMIGGSVISGVMGSNNASRAADAQVEAAEAAADESARQYDLSREDLAPYRQSGYNALAALNYEMGLGSAPGVAPQVLEIAGQEYTHPGAVNPGASNPNLQYVNHALQSLGVGGAYGDLNAAGGGSTTTSPTQFMVNGQYYDTREAAQAAADAATFEYAGFQETPGYQYAVDEGQQAIERRAAASGMRHSGDTLQRLQEHRQGVANQDYGNYLNRLSGLAGTGQSAVNTGAALGAQNASTVGNALMTAGNARASGYAGQTTALNGTLNNLAQIGGMSQAGYFGGGGNSANALSAPWASGGFWG